MDQRAPIVGISNRIEFYLTEESTEPMRDVDGQNCRDETFSLLETGGFHSCNIFFKPVNNSWNHSFLPDAPPPRWLLQLRAILSFQSHVQLLTFNANPN